MNYKPGAAVPTTGIWQCTVCRTPEELCEGDRFPECRNLCGRGLWRLVQERDEPRS